MCLGSLFSHWRMAWNLVIGWEIKYLFLDSTHWSKSKEKTLKVWQKTFPLDIFHWLMAQLLNIHLEFQCVLLGFIWFWHFPFKLSTSWVCKSSSKVQFQKPLLVKRVPSAYSFIQLPVGACLLNALFQVTIVGTFTGFIMIHLIFKCLERLCVGPILFLPLESLSQPN